MHEGIEMSTRAALIKVVVQAAERGSNFDMGLLAACAAMQFVVCEGAIFKTLKVPGRPE